MLGKTKMDIAQKGGSRLQAKNNKWYRYFTQTQLLLFAVMHLVLGMYFAFVSTEYANNAGFTAQIESLRTMGEEYLKKGQSDSYELVMQACALLKANLHLEQVCAVICFALVILWLGVFGTLRKRKKISILYYVGLVVSAVLPFAYMAISREYIVDAVTNVLLADKDIIVDGVGTTNEITFWAGFRFGMWENNSEFNSKSQIVMDYLSKLGVESGAKVKLAEFDIAGLIDMFKVEKYSWNKFELYAIINAVASVALMACAIILIPLKGIKLPKIFLKKAEAPKQPKTSNQTKAPKQSKKK